MTPVITDTWERDYITLIYDGIAYPTEKLWTRCSDIRDTPIGPVDFGWVRIGPTRSAPPYRVGPLRDFERAAISKRRRCLTNL